MIMGLRRTREKLEENKTYKVRKEKILEEAVRKNQILTFLFVLLSAVI